MCKGEKDAAVCVKLPLIRMVRMWKVKLGYEPPAMPLGIQVHSAGTFAPLVILVFGGQRSMTRSLAPSILISEKCSMQSNCLTGMDREL